MNSHNSLIKVLEVEPLLHQLQFSTTGSITFSSGKFIQLVMVNIFGIEWILE